MTAMIASSIHDIFRSSFVDDNLFIERLGGSKTDPNIIARYLSLPMRSRPEISCYFDRDFYLHCYPDIAKVDIDPIVHFMLWGIGEGRAPHPLIDIAHILKVGAGFLPNPMTINALHDALHRDLIDPSALFSLEFYRSQLKGFESPREGLLKHFLQIGILQGLRPIPSFDPASYYCRSDRKSLDLRSGLRFFATLGTQFGNETVVESPTDSQSDMLFRSRADLNKAICATHPLRFDLPTIPDLTVILVITGDFALILQTLASLRSNYAGPMELILINSGSPDETRHLSHYVSGARILNFEATNSVAHFVNASLGIATADVVLFLHGAIELGYGAVAAAIARLKSDSTIGAVGPKVVRTSGALQEAGCIIWHDGWTSGYLRDQSPLLPEANFVRGVDFCSMACLLTRRTLVCNLGGLDTALTETCFQDADLCIRMRTAGYRIVYDPSVVVYQLASDLRLRNDYKKQRIDDIQQIFYKKHHDRLSAASVQNGRNHLFARSVDEVKGRVLLFEDQLPLRRLGSGFVRSNDIVRTISALGYQVTVYPINPNTHDLAAIYSDFPTTVEIIHDRSLKQLAQFLRERLGFFNTIWIARSHNLNLVRPILEQNLGDSLYNIRLIFDTEAIEATREELRHGIIRSSSAFDLNQSLRTELHNASFCQTIIAVNEKEARQIQALGFSNVKIIGHSRAVALTSRDWKNRAGMLFIGAIHTPDSPNLDSLRWFIQDVLPLIEAQLEYETHLTIAGYTAANVDLAPFRHHPRITLRGSVTDPTPLYDAARVFVAPTRYAAGLPYKIHESASYGLPVVATELLRRQLGWEHGQDLLSAEASDPVAFAHQVVTLYQSETLWEQVRDCAAQRIRKECASDTVARVIAEILR